MIHALTLLLLVWFSAFAQAADEAPWYEVELIVFRYTADTAGGERWPENPGMPSLQNAVMLKPPGSAISRTPPDGATDNAASTSSASLAATASESASEPDDGHSPLPFERINEASLQLAGVARALRKSSGYTPLLHLGWRQPGAIKDGAVYLAAGPAEQRTLEGTATLSLGRFLHLAIDLVLRPDGAGPLYRLTESRRMRSQELHYFDHPKFGVIARITPYAIGKTSAPATNAAGGNAVPADVAAPAAADEVAR